MKKYILLFIDLSLLFYYLYISLTDKLIFNEPWYVLAVIYLYFLSTILPSIFPFFNKNLFNGRHFKKHYKKNNNIINYSIIKKDNTKALVCLIIWIIGMVIVGFSYYKISLVNDNIIFLLTLIILICEWICLYVFCVFKNIIKTGNCCSTCRIKNYDNFFRFSLFLFVRKFFTLSLFTLGVIALILWEVQFKRHPEYFYKNTNSNINCKYCKNSNINCLKNKKS